MMNNNTTMNVQDQAPNCVNGCGFYGNPTTQNLCSTCFRDLLKKTALETEIKPCHIDINDDVANSTCNTSVKKTINRCDACKKRVGLTGFECRCGRIYCGSHRYPEEHSCSIDHKELGRETLSKALYAAADCKATKLDYKL